MYIEPGFYDMVSGAIGTLNFVRDISSKLSDEQKQEYVSKQSNARMRAFLNNAAYGMLGDAPLDPLDTFMKARNDSWADLDDRVCREMSEINVQVGNKESYELILRMEQHPHFIEWANPALVTMLKETYLKQTTTKL